MLFGSRTCSLSNPPIESFAKRAAAVHGLICTRTGPGLSLCLHPSPRRLCGVGAALFVTVCSRLVPSVSALGRLSMSSGLFCYVYASVYCKDHVICHSNLRVQREKFRGHRLQQLLQDCVALLPYRPVARGGAGLRTGSKVPCMVQLGDSSACTRSNIGARERQVGVLCIRLRRRAARREETKPRSPGRRQPQMGRADDRC